MVDAPGLEANTQLAAERGVFGSPKPLSWATTYSLENDRLDFLEARLTRAHPLVSIP